jgi:GrpB-like predicted nucleotidyltransferase (UPF0157 family)
MTSVRKIEVVDYDPSWPTRYAAEREIILRSLGDLVVAIHHIGSTAVPGLAAKPIVDIMLAVRDLSALDARNAEMEALGYRPMGESGVAGRRYFKKGGDDRTHQAHAYVSGDPNLSRHLAFRDYLRLHPDVAREYGDLKRSIAQSCDNDIARYCDGKDAWVKRVEAVAVREQRGADPRP